MPRAIRLTTYISRDDQDIEVVARYSGGEVGTPTARWLDSGEEVELTADEESDARAVLGDKAAEFEEAQRDEAADRAHDEAKDRRHDDASWSW